MAKRILCPIHSEKTPSCVLHSDGYYKCYGCGAYGKTNELNLSKEQLEIAPKYIEDLEESLTYIRSLPVGSFRGLSFPYDEMGFYVVWPDGSYYKRRNFNTVNQPKYRGAAGIPKPLFKARIKGTPAAIIVEGELNALSLCEVVSCDVISPGGTGDFVSSRFNKDLTTYLNYEKLYLIADEDDAGATALIKLSSKLKQHIGCVLVGLMKPDANHVLEHYGKEKLKDELKRMGLQEWL